MKRIQISISKMILTECLFLFMLLHSSVDSKTFSPIVLVPGDGGSRAYQYQKSDLFCKKQLIWINYYYLLFPQKLNKIFKLIYNPATHSTSDMPNTNISFPGWGSTENIETLGYLPVGRMKYFKYLVEDLVKIPFYIRNKTIRGAPYDFRRAPNENKDFVTNLKKLIEETFINSGNNKVVLLGHSLGSLYSLYFLKKMDISWKRKFMRSFLSVNGPFGGAVQAIYSETHGIPYMIQKNARYFRELERTFPSIAFLLPKPEVFGKDPLVVTSKRSYSAFDYKELFQDMDMKYGNMMYEDTKNLVNASETPTGLDEIYCVYSKGIQTPKKLIFSSFPDSEPIVGKGDGDGTVNLESLQVCRNWKNTKYLVLEKEQHVDILKSSEFINFLMKILYQLPTDEFQYHKLMDNIL